MLRSSLVSAARPLAAVRHGVFLRRLASPASAGDGSDRTSAGSGEKSGTARAPRSSARSRGLRPYLELSKYRLSGLVVGSTLAGAMMAGSPVAWPAVAAACGGTALASAAANTCNQLYEVKTDARMKRTRARPLPAGRISREKAAAFAGVMTASSAALLVAGAGPVAAALGVGNIALYAAVYTPMKQRSIWNTWVGSVVGAIPPLMGYAAVGGDLLSLPALLVAGTLYSWQFPHFFALAWLNKADYAAGGHAMLPVVEPDGRRTAAVMLRHSLALTAMPLAAYLGGVSSAMLVVDASLINLYFLALVAAFKRDPSNGAARRVFRNSLWTLPALLTLLCYHSWNYAADDEEEGSETAAEEAALWAELLHDADSVEEDSVDAAVQQLKTKLTAACPHELLKSDSELHAQAEATGRHPGKYCPVMPVEAVVVEDAKPAAVPS